MPSITVPTRKIRRIAREEYDLLLAREIGVVYYCVNTGDWFYNSNDIPLTVTSIETYTESVDVTGTPYNGVIARLCEEEYTTIHYVVARWEWRYVGTQGISAYTYSDNIDYSNRNSTSITPSAFTKEYLGVWFKDENPTNITITPDELRELLGATVVD